MLLTWWRAILLSVAVPALLRIERLLEKMFKHAQNSSAIHTCEIAETRRAVVEELKKS